MIHKLNIKLLWLAILQAIVVYTKAQNLVSNGYFEVYSTCPNNISQINYATGWVNAEPASSPDYFNSCASVSSQLNVPYTVFGYQQDCCGGMGIAGIYVFNKAFPNDGKEYIQTKLTNTLNAGHKYLASMYVNNCDDYNYAIASMGMYFTSTAIQGPSSVGFMNVPNPQIKNTTLLNDTINWMLVQDTFIAVGNEVYLTIGNFSYDSLSDTVKVYNTTGQDYAYYYIDGVSVYDVATLGIEQVAGNKVQVALYPNPNNGTMSIEYTLAKDASLGICDINGNLVGKYNLPAGNNKLDVKNDNLSNGVYVYRVIGDKITTGKFVIMK